MKKLLSLILTLALVLGLCACSSSGNTETTGETEETTLATEPTGKIMEGLQVGFSRKSIMPKQLGVQIAGGDASARLSDGALDEVATTCIAIAQDSDIYLIFTMDFMVLNKGCVEAIKPVVAETTGVPEERIILNCTHTHSGVNILSLSWDGAEAYRNQVAKASAKAAEAAIEDLSPVEVHIGSTATEGIAFVRHYRMNDGSTYGNGHGTTASGYKSHMYEAANEVQAIKFTRAAEDKKDIILMSFPAHATTINGVDAKKVSACYPGQTRMYIEENADVHCAFFQGASGDQVPDSKIQGLSAAKKDYKKYGQILGDYVLGLTYEQVPGEQVIMQSWEYIGNSMKEGIDDPVLMAAAKEVKNASSKYGSSSNEAKAAYTKHGFTSVYEATGLVDREKAPDTRSAVLNVLQIGEEVSMVFVPFEMFGMHGDLIKEKSPFKMDMIVTCSDIYMGYLPHLEGCDEGFYEYDVTKFERGTGEKLVEEYANVLTMLKNAG